MMIFKIGIFNKIEGRGKDMKGKNEKSLLKRLSPVWQFLEPLKGWIILSCLASFVEGLIMIYYAFVKRNLTDLAIKGEVNEFISFVIFTAIVVGVSVIVGYVKRYSTVRYMSEFAYSLRSYVAKHITDLPMMIKDKYHSGDIVSRINNDISSIAELVGKISELILNPIIFIIAFVYMCFISWKLLIVSVILMPLTGYLFNIVSKPIEENSKKIMEDTAKLNELAKDTINGVYIMKSFNLEKSLLEKYKKTVKEIIDRGVKIERINASLMRLFLGLRYIPQLIVPLFGGYLAINGEITAGQLLASTTLIWYVFTAVENLFGLKRSLQMVIPAVDRIFEIINEDIEPRCEEKLIIKENYPAVKLSSVCFEYSEGNQVLNNLSFELQKGTITAIVGPSGCGKTTILKLLCGFYRNYSGDIEVLGNNLKDCCPSDIRKYISYVSQNTYLFPGTILENIAYGRDRASEDDIIEAAKLANAHNFIMSLPNGYNTVIGDGSIKLSGGEQQRISLARAILKDASILLLDEATSALDLESESLVQKSLQKFMRNRTALVVAHRMSTIKNADMILVVKDGEIVEMGTHDELIEKDSFYKRLYYKQFCSIDDSSIDSEGGIVYA